MASRYYYQFPNSLEKRIVSLFFNVPIAGSGAIGTVDYAKNKGLNLVAKTATGLYTFTLGDHTTGHLDQYNRVLSVSGTTLLAGGAQAIVGVQLVADAVQASSTFEISTLSATATNASPDSGAVLIVRVDLLNI